MIYIKQKISLLMSLVDFVTLVVLATEIQIPTVIKVSLTVMLGSSLLDLFAVRYNSYKKRKEQDNKK